VIAFRFQVSVFLLMMWVFTLSATELRIGNFDGKNWSGVPQALVKVPAHEEELKVQLGLNEGRLFLCVRIPQKEVNLKHRPWVLKDEKFVVGKQLEDSLALRFSQEGKEIQDLWFWGANRTQWGFADDGFFKDGKYSPDAGKGPWKLNLSLESLHRNRSRYLQAKPSASRSDVKVQAKYLAGEWELIFVRALKSEHEDDLVLTKNFSLSLSKDQKSQSSKLIKVSFNEAAE